MNEIKYTYFQYQKELDLPIFIRTDLSNFSSELISFFSQMRFVELSDKEAANVEEELTELEHTKVITLELAEYPVAKQIDSVAESDRWGMESIIPKDGYKVYRYKGVAIVMYSNTVAHWRMGCHQNFGSQESLMESRAVINRLLSWALAPLGLIGFWGVPVEEGMVILKQSSSQAEVVFIDIRNRKVISVDGVHRLGPRFKVLRLDPSLKNRNIRMSHEELFSFLSVNCSYFDNSGHIVAVRQMIQRLSRLMEGLIHPQESFQPRSDLSL